MTCHSPLFLPTLIKYGNQKQRNTISYSNDDLTKKGRKFTKQKFLKGTVMQIEKALINDHSRVSKVS